MPRFAIGQAIASTTPTIVVDPGLALGGHRFQLEVVDGGGLRSAPAVAVVNVQRLVIQPPGPIPIPVPGPEPLPGPLPEPPPQPPDEPLPGLPPEPLPEPPSPLPPGPGPAPLPGPVPGPLPRPGPIATGPRPATPAALSRATRRKPK